MAFGRGPGGLDCCGVTSKYILFFFNLLILLAGLVVLILGIVFLVREDLNMYKDFSPEQYRAAAITLIVAGAVVMLFSFFGCCGAIKESKCLLFTYATLVLLAFLVVLAASILALVFKSEAREVVEVTMKMLLDNYNDDPNARRAWDGIQRAGECCGIKSYADWQGRVPTSCCKNGGPCTSSGYFSEGCFSKFIGNVESFVAAIGYVGLGFAAFLLLALILAFTVGCSL